MSLAPLEQFHQYLSMKVNLYHLRQQGCQVPLGQELILKHMRLEDKQSLVTNVLSPNALCLADMMDHI